MYLSTKFYFCHNSIHDTLDLLHQKYFVNRLLCFGFTSTSLIIGP